MLNDKESVGPENVERKYLPRSRHQVDQEFYRRERLFQYDLYNFLLKRVNKKNVSKFFNMIKKGGHHGSEVNKNGKHVMFADSLGMDLELVHTIQLKNAQLDGGCLLEFRKVMITKQTNDQTVPASSHYETVKEIDVDQADDEEESDSLSSSMLSFNYKLTNNSAFCLHHKTILPKFNLEAEKSYQTLIQNGVCLNSIDIYNAASIRGTIITLTPKSNEYATEWTDRTSKRKQLTRRLSKIFTSIAQETKSDIDSTTLNSKHKLDLVYVIWSVNEWASWKYHAAIQKTCRIVSTKENGSCILKTHEFFMQDLESVFNLDQTLQLIVCHQVDMNVARDTNHDTCYEFKCAYNI